MNKKPIQVDNIFGKAEDIRACRKKRTEVNMSPKELLYIEDTLGHEKQMKQLCQNLAGQIQDGELKSLVSSLACKHDDSYNRFYSLLNS